MSEITLHEGDNRLSLRRLINEGVRVHSVVTDPPYGLVSIQKRFGKNGAAPAKTENTDGSFSRLSGGFMGVEWDSTGIERDPEFWRLIYDILLPGGCVFAFSGARTGHWQACAMEQAGFIMHPMHGWAYSSGFPKAHDAAKAIDKMLGLTGEVVETGTPVKRLIPGAQQYATGDWTKTDERMYQPGQYVPASEEAAKWQGWAYGAQTQKPALEPIYLGQKPFSEKSGAANLVKHGVGAFNVDACRVPLTPDDKNIGRSNETRPRTEDDGWGMGSTQGKYFVPPEGRHPANLLHDGTESVVALFPESKGQQGLSTDKQRSQKNVYGSVTKGDKVYVPRNDSGSASRFFNSFSPDDIPPIFYNKKADKNDRAGTKHPTVKPVALIQHLIRHITPPGGIVLDPFAGSGTTAEAARREGFDCILMEAEASYAEFIRGRFDLIDPSDDWLDLLFA